MNSRSAVLTLALALLCLAPAGAQAHDSLAPPGAKHAWLPAHDDWVMQHWIPFDESDLYAALGIDNVAMERWLRNDHHTVEQLAQRKGLTAAELKERLLAPRRGTVSDGQMAVLEERTDRFMTQGHLAQHVLFHYFHGSYVLENTRSIYGVDRRTYKRMRLDGATPLAIGRRGGRTPAQVDKGMRRILRYGADIGTKDGSQTPEQAAYMLRRRDALLSCFLRRPMPKLDPGNPFGDPDNGHGFHARGNRNGLLADSKEARARRDPHSCWHEPSLPAEAPPLKPTGETPAQARRAVADESALCHLAGI